MAGPPVNPGLRVRLYPGILQLQAMRNTANGQAIHERELIAAASEGDEAAFGRLVDPHRAALHAHCYRMLASLHDAEDALQDAMLRAWRGLPRFDGRGSFRAWLYRIATNTCLDTIRRRPKRVLPIDYGPPGAGLVESDEPVDPGVWIDPYPDSERNFEDGYATPESRYEQREAIELAFVAALQHLPPRQRAVLILRDVLGFSAKETADAMDTTPTATNSALQRARESVEKRLPEQSQQATLRALGDARVRAVVDRFVDAFERGDVPAILALLTDDATFGMPPFPAWSRGRDAVGESWLMPEELPTGLRYAATSANGQLALGTYRLVEEAQRYEPIALDVLTLEPDGQISDVLAFRTPEVFPAFGLAPALPAA
jgi:RNA polymerase sigma-70 factor (ECF subfamily)